jgi:hypothetical protein
MLLLVILVMAVLVGSGCTSFVPWFGGQEVAQNKDEQSNTTSFRVNNPGGTTALAAAEADKVRMEGMARIREAEARVEMARIEAEAAVAGRRAAEASATVWRDRAIWAAIALAVSCLLFPGIALWLWRKASRLADALWQYRGEMEPAQVKELDARSAKVRIA